MTSAPDLADRFHRRWLATNPLAASMYGIPGYDDLVPDESEAGQQAWRAEVVQFLEETATIEREPLTPADAVTLDCTTGAVTQELAIIDSAQADHTVTAMPYAGPPTFMAVAARTVLVDAAAAQAYLTRLRRAGPWIDQLSERLRTGAGRGRFPVAPLVEQAIAWAEAILAQPAPGPVLSPQPPQGWSGAAAWEEERRAVAAEVLAPALARWVATITELLPRARPSAAGRTGLPARRRGRLCPGGPDLYDPAAVPGRTASDRPGSGRRPGGPRRRARRRAGAFRAGRGIRRGSGLGRADAARGGHPAGGARGEAGRGPGGGNLP